MGSQSKVIIENPKQIFKKNEQLGIRPKYLLQAGSEETSYIDKEAFK